MGARKRIAAEKRKEAKKTQYFAKLKGCPSSPRKMRYVVDMIRGMEVNRALGVLRFSKKAASENVEKLLRSAIANWEAKNERKAEDGERKQHRRTWSNCFVRLSPTGKQRMSVKQKTANSLSLQSSLTRV
jgi:hypothetical protein